MLLLLLLLLLVGVQPQLTVDDGIFNGCHGDSAVTASLRLLSAAEATTH